MDNQPDTEKSEKIWSLLGEWKPISPAPGFQGRFWQRVAREEVAFERKPVFVFLKIRPYLKPAFVTLATILIIGAYWINLLSVRNFQRLTLETANEDISMLQKLDLTEELDVIQNLHILEDFEIVDSLKL